MINTKRYPIEYNYFLILIKLFPFPLRHHMNPPEVSKSFIKFIFVSGFFVIWLGSGDNHNFSHASLCSLTQTIL